jgi:hypothetical protein
MNLQRHVWEGWTVQSFIDELEPMFNIIMSNSREFGTNKFESDEELKKWCKDNQPYYKKHIPEVYKYFKSLRDKYKKGL